MFATALIMTVAFCSIFFVVQETVLRNLDNDLSYEAEKHTNEIETIRDSLRFKNKAEWEEKEHREIQVNPVFIQLIDKQGRLMDKSPNLKQDYLSFKEAKFGGHFDSKLNDRGIRQVQLPIEKDGRIKGYILAAMSSESAKSIILKLRNVLVISFFIILAGLYYVSRLLAGRSIKPVQLVSNTITQITKCNLKERVELPQHKDELYELSSNFNSLIARIENALEREKQFTSDASHELRTPLAALQGTLEVLIRKPRTQLEYEQKVKYSLSEIARMTNILEQLLLLARFDESVKKNDEDWVPLPTIINESLMHFKNIIEEKALKVDFQFDQDKKFLVPQYYTDLILENILSNAIKYSKNDSVIKITIEEIGTHVVCTIQDQGIGINNEDLQHIYDNFFRSEALSHKGISGNGLGLSIVKKAADAIRAKTTITSKQGIGTMVCIEFNGSTSSTNLNLNP
ncbi:ATP-binding protein [uncultured Imperialibacter sp.]|uniref:sensor histidine kinase n=1 Tax=uncultured Imperialibacter sp. TaxID=1672639 RepID=UPI0030DC8CF7|tara:strand:- start:14608 stop:15978 length:1371 start_codon:yes stop_codon:yes gene_type:complete